MNIRDATRDDAKALAYLINLAGEGIPEYFWKTMAAEGELPLAVGAERAMREEGNFSYKNAKVCVENDQVAGMILSYKLPAPYLLGNLAEYPELVHPLVKLEAQVPGSWYINAVATFEEFRGRGIATLLLRHAEEQAHQAACNTLSLIVASENINAVKLYEKLGLIRISTLPVILYEGCMHGGKRILMTKNISTI